MLGRNDIEQQGSSTNKSSNRDWKRIVPGLIISIISLAVVLYLAKPGQLYQALRLANYRLVVLALVGGLAWLAVRAIAWRVLLQNKASYSQVFCLVGAGLGAGLRGGLGKGLGAMSVLLQPQDG